MHATSPKTRRFLLIAQFVVYAVIAVGVGVLLTQLVGEPYLSMSRLDVNEYLHHAGNLRGNAYTFEGTIANALAWTPDEGRLFSVDVATDSETDVLPVLIPAHLNQQNVQKGQVYHFSVEVVERGLIRVRDMRKK
jgi:hypothetical protein